MLDAWTAWAMTREIGHLFSFRNLESHAVRKGVENSPLNAVDVDQHVASPSAALVASLPKRMQGPEGALQCPRHARVPLPCSCLPPPPSTSPSHPNLGTVSIAKQVQLSTSILDLVSS